MKRLAAVLLSLGLLAVTAAEAFHNHLSGHDDHCLACSLESHAVAAAPAPVVVPPAPTRWTPVAVEAAARGAWPAPARRCARAPPLA